MQGSRCGARLGGARRGARRRVRRQEVKDGGRHWAADDGDGVVPRGLRKVLACRKAAEEGPLGGMLAEIRFGLGGHSSHSRE